MYSDLTSAELADALDRVRGLSPDLTGPLSMLDEASLGWTGRYPQLTELQQAFSQARHKQWPHTRTKQTWQEVVTTAGALATALRELGDIRLERCTARTGWGTCGLALPEKGSCRAEREHLAPAAGSETDQ
ncbi:hypothetical protein ACFWP7_22435 [Streptomyces sp. NPDC058470]|uniref:hypothetical protein n=1 Tax=Streptomyces sp. NPDC058470 TaxID=3346515 RepID=UPI003667BA5A